MNHLKRFAILALAGTLATACTVNHRLNRQLSPHTNDALSQAFVGICIYDDQAQRYLYEHQATKQFIPASNIKLLTAYAAVLHLPDSLPGWLRYETNDTIFLKPNGDPTFLHPSFPRQSVYNALNTTPKTIMLKWPKDTRFRRLGYGWAWNNYQEWYMPERSAMPIYGNVVRFTKSAEALVANPSYFQPRLTVNGPIGDKPVTINRNEDSNDFTALPASLNRLVRPFTQKENPRIAYSLLIDTLLRENPLDIGIIPSIDSLDSLPYQPWYTQATDTVLRHMMHHSDNFFAEQLLLITGAQLTGTLDGRAARQCLLADDFDFFDNHPKWMDGSGLSRYNAVSPKDIVALLTHMKREIPWPRITAILPHGNQGTLKGYYVGREQHIYAKTGTLGSHIALSGYLITKRGKQLTFSFLVNNHQSTAITVRKAIERQLTQLIDHY